MFWWLLATMAEVVSSLPVGNSKSAILSPPWEKSAPGPDVPPLIYGVPFLNQVSSVGQMNLFNIFSEKNLTKAQERIAVHRWAEKNNVSSEWSAYEAEMNEKQRNATQAIDEVVQHLTSYHRQLRQIVQNFTISSDAEEKAIQELSSELKVLIRKELEPFITYFFYLEDEAAEFGLVQTPGGIPGLANGPNQLFSPVVDGLSDSNPASAGKDLFAKAPVLLYDDRF